MTSNVPLVPMETPLTTLRFGLYELRPRTRELYKQGTKLKLRPQPFQVLQVLVEHAGDVVTREELRQLLWSSETFVDFEHGLNTSIKELRAVLNDSAGQPRYIETLPKLGYRIIVPVEVSQPPATGKAREPVNQVDGSLRPPTPPNAQAVPGIGNWWKLIPAAAAVLVALAVGNWWISSRKTHALTNKDTIVLADFTNTTGDPVFDETLKQGLSIQLRQSPFLELISDRRVNDTLKLMGRAAEDRLTPEVTREICMRTGSIAMLSGSIVSLGNQYVIGLKAINCETGDVLAQMQDQAADKEAVLKALDAEAVSMRGKLGESLGTIQKFSTPLRQATTTSLEALETYSLAMKTSSTNGAAAAMPLLKRTIELDPSFAEVYAAISSHYAQLNQPSLAEEYARKAFELRGKASDSERFPIETNYYEVGTREPEKAAQTCELWWQAFPRDARPLRDLGFMYSTLGNHEKALGMAQQAMTLGPHTSNYYLILGREYTNLNQLDNAEATYKEAEDHQLQDESLLFGRYQLAFVKGDTPKMAQAAANAAMKPGAEDLLLAAQADTEAWNGRLRSARELTRRAVDSALQNGAKETAAIYQAEAALHEVESGNLAQARAGVDAALKLARNRDVQVMSALVLARAGDTSHAEKLASELEKQFPLDTIAQRFWLPGIRAALALQRKDPNRVLDSLNAVGSIELTTDFLKTIQAPLCTAYLRGEAYLAIRDGVSAATEFRKFTDHRGIVGNFPWGALARLGLARAYAIQGDMPRARSAYQEFLTLWKGADPDAPIFSQAKAEYTKLK
jgi:DNA-binding winged helix-turn-helix (wHTH) protein/tetratricopeptide (TPR) repeat protein